MQETIAPMMGTSWTDEEDFCNENYHLKSKYQLTSCGKKGHCKNTEDVAINGWLNKDVDCTKK